tara:strand:+ start:59 stop:763 length:705 start_codon:yes stop_codon:yes gene_type:complete
MAPAKTTKTKTATPTPSEPVVETKKSTTPTKETAQKTTTKATKAQKVTKQPEQVNSSVKEVVPTTPVTEVQNVVVQVDTESSVSDGFSEFFTKFQAMISQFGSLKTELKHLERRTVKQLKVVQKINNKKRKKGVRAPSGFVKPSPISEELATFLGKEKGVEMARTDVTREINKYIRAHDLQDKENGRKINPDQPLRTLLKLDNEPDIVLTYFNLQRYMGPHFPKSAKTTESTTA